MPKKAVRALVSGAIVIAALSLLFYTTARDGAQLYKHVEEVTTNPQAWYGKNLQLHGFAKDIKVNPASLDYRFQIQSQGQVLQASYKGIVPDTFKEGAEVVLTGRLSPHGFDVAPGGVTAKCPSKYVAGPASQ
jgi:cytochrome c-type biogenesis protein CcmE